MSRKRSCLLISVFFLTVTAGSFLHFSRWSRKLTSPQSPSALAGLDPPPVVEVPLPELESLGILLLGYGGPGHEGSFLTDVIQLVYFDFDKSRLALVSIPRDLWVEGPDHVSRKVNTVFARLTRTPSTTRENVKPEAAKSGGDAAKQIVSQVTGLPIDYFIAIDFVGFQRAIGELEGIEVEVAAAFDDPWYPVQGRELETCGLTPQEIKDLSEKYSGFELEKHFPCRYEQLHFDQGKVHLEGGEALKFVRSRHGSGGGDFSRHRRQQAVLKGLKDRLLTLNAPGDAIGFFRQLVRHVMTDLDAEVVQYLTPLLAKMGEFEIVTINLTTENVLGASVSRNGAFILVPQAGADQWQPVHQFVEQSLGAASKPD